jgi:hypothetical protein
MKRLTGNADHLHLLVRHFSPRWILATVEAAGDQASPLAVVVPAIKRTIVS